jgi:hypothetical protein
MKKKQFFEVRKIKMPGNFFTGTLFEINKEEKKMSKIQKLPEDMIKESAIWHMRRVGDRRFFCLSPLYPLLSIIFLKFLIFNKKNKGVTNENKSFDLCK